MNQPPPTALNVNLPPEQVEGHFADFASVWHNDETFILDFASMVHPPGPGTDAEGNQAMVVNAVIVARVRVPPSQVWELMKAMQAQLGQWEAQHPERQPPQPPH